MKPDAFDFKCLFHYKMEVIITTNRNKNSNTTILVTQKHNSFLFSYVFILFYVYMCLAACIYTCASHMCLVPEEPELGTESPETGVKKTCVLHVVAGN